MVGGLAIQVGLMSGQMAVSRKSGLLAGALVISAAANGAMDWMDSIADSTPSGQKEVMPDAV